MSTEWDLVGYSKLDVLQGVSKHFSAIWKIKQIKENLLQEFFKQVEVFNKFFFGRLLNLMGLFYFIHTFNNIFKDCTILMMRWKKQANRNNFEENNV